MVMARPPCSSIVVTVRAATLVVHVDDRERRTRLRESLGDGGTESAAAAGDHGHPPSSRNRPEA
jgi:hypothetical protein